MASGPRPLRLVELTIFAVTGAPIGFVVSFVIFYPLIY
jgi:hypothetical protein